MTWDEVFLEVGGADGSHSGQRKGARVREL